MAYICDRAPRNVHETIFGHCIRFLGHGVIFYLSSNYEVVDRSRQSSCRVLTEHLWMLPYDWGWTIWKCQTLRTLSSRTLANSTCTIAGFKRGRIRGGGLAPPFQWSSKIVLSPTFTQHLNNFYLGQSLRKGPTLKFSCSNTIENSN